MKVKRLSLTDFFSRYALVFVLLALIAFFAFMSEHFLSGANAINIARQVSVIGICAVGMTFVILSVTKNLSEKTLRDAQGDNTIKSKR